MKKFYYTLLAVFFMLPACTKTDIVPFTPETDNQLLEYKIVNVQGSPIYGAINQQDSSITVYLPFYLQLITLEPEMKVSDGATVTPVSGTMIEDLLDLFHKGREIKYNVKGKDGKVKTYTLHIQVQQPDLILQEVSTDAANPNTYSLNMNLDFDSFSFGLDGAGFAAEDSSQVWSFFVCVERVAAGTSLGEDRFAGCCVRVGGAGGQADCGDEEQGPLHPACSPARGESTIARVCFPPWKRTSVIPRT